MKEFLSIPFLAESDEKEEQPTPIEIVFGQMDESVEETLFNLKVGEFTQPILTQMAGIFLNL